jgi:hypothetical protein
MQEPPEQTSPLAHFTPQPPQLMLLLVVSTQAPPQSCWPVAHAHVPLVHVSPFWQTVPHAPQFALSLVRSTQEFWHGLSGVWHPEEHLP